MNVLITGHEGFIGKNFLNYLNINHINTFKFGTKSSFSDIEKNINKFDVIFHFAGQNRAKNKKEFIKNNEILTKNLTKILEKKNLKTPIIYTSTIKVNESSDYGISKKNSEKILIKSFKKRQASLAILRLPNLFGKWSKPNYNSVVATFCYNISRNLNVLSNKKYISLLYIDDLVRFLFEKFIINFEIFKKKNIQKIYKSFYPTKLIKVKELEKKITLFEKARNNFYLPDLKNDFDKKLYSTFLTYLPTKKFTYELDKNVDKRGIFCEVFKHSKFGQISFLTINPKKSRGEHFHNTKVEKFLLVDGKCRFKFKDLNSNKEKIIMCDSKKPKIVETIPGWVHKIYNTSDKIAVVMIWTNEVFDANNPDTYSKLIN